MEKNVEEYEDQIEKLKVNMDGEKAQIYAEKGSAQGLLDQDVVIKRDKIANSLETNFGGFDAELTQVEKDDIDIHRTQLQLEKEKELEGAEAAIDEEVNKSESQKMMQEQKDALKKKIDEQDDPN